MSLSDLTGGRDLGRLGRAFALRFDDQTGLLRRLGLRLTFHPPYLERGAVFIHVPKAAGNTVTRTIYGSASHELGGHATARLYHRANPALARRLHFFAFVRNPFDRFHSAFYFLNAGGMPRFDAQFAREVLGPVGSFAGFVRRMGEDAAFRDTVLGYLHFMPHTHFLCDRRGRLLVDQLCYYEHFDAEMDGLCARFGIDNPGLVANPTREKDASLAQDMTPEAIALVQHLYAEDFRLLGYDTRFDAGALGPVRAAAGATRALRAASA
ncbi:MAG: sulfotransferase family 2 domain-containing protein [Alphaproteobacteria bacterium]|nr:sulfotransferase family 2 domain-containing protein [Alphaproteobacteria bacterium]